jgi:hypothetical protein
MSGTIRLTCVAFLCYVCRSWTSPTEPCDWQCYLDRYPDLQKLHGPSNVVAAAEHYMRTGRGEARDCTCKGPTKPYPPNRITSDEHQELGAARKPPHGFKYPSLLQRQRELNKQRRSNPLQLSGGFDQEPPHNLLHTPPETSGQPDRPRRLDSEHPQPTATNLHQNDIVRTSGQGSGAARPTTSLCELFLDPALCNGVLVFLFLVLVIWFGYAIACWNTTTHRSNMHCKIPNRRRLGIAFVALIGFSILYTYVL